MDATRCISWTLAALTLTLVAITAHASAQLLEDPAGDVMVAAGGTGTPASADAVDLLTLSIMEEPDQLILRLELGSLDGQVSDARADAPSHRVYFAFGESEYRIYMGRPIDNQYTWAFLQQAEGTAWRTVDSLQAKAVPSEAAMVVDIPRELLRDEHGRTPAAGDVLDGWHVLGQAQVSGALNTGSTAGQPVAITDRMPDDGTGSLTIALGGAASSGALHLDSDAPYRASNGGDARIVYEATLASKGEASTVSFEVRNVPAGWNVEVPAALELPTDAVATVHVVTELPFGHRHGGSESFTLVAHAETGHAELELGVWFLDTPQPAGHHNTVYLHSRGWDWEGRDVNPPLGGTEGRVWMNTAEEDADDDGTPITGSSWDNTATAQYRWYVCLEPELALGLDFDLERQGTLRMPLDTTRPLGASSVSGRLVHLGPGSEMSNCYPSQWDGRKTTELGRIASDDFDLADQHVVEAAFTPLAAADRVPFEKGSMLVLELVLDVENPGVLGSAGPKLQPGASLQLPLHEYHDARPAGLVGDVPDVVVPASAPAAAPSEDAPGAPAVLLLGLLGAVVLRRR